MSGDIGLFSLADGTLDVQVASNDLSVDEGLQTAVLISLNTDARANDDEVLAEDSSRRGWWGDVFPSEPGDQIGCKLWLIKREKRSLETLNRAEEYSKEALQWMIDDGVAESVDTSASWDPSGAMLLEISITKPGESQAAPFRFKMKWGAEADRS
jgi:phage gp46-like protein